jgi:hypothetical protein
LTTTYFALIRDLADSPMKIPEKLAAALQAPNARNFMVSYVMLQCELHNRLHSRRFGSRR